MQIINVQQIVTRCQICNRVFASFYAPKLVLQPLLIMNLGYPWSLDFATPLSITKRYILVMISQHFSKWIELVALLDKFSGGAAYAFLN